MGRNTVSNAKCEGVLLYMLFCVRVRVSTSKARVYKRFRCKCLLFLQDDNRNVGFFLKEKKIVHFMVEGKQETRVDFIPRWRQVLFISLPSLCPVYPSFLIYFPSSHPFLPSFFPFLRPVFSASLPPSHPSYATVNG